MFIDRIRLRIVAGKGGNGIVAWRREKYVPKGGPTGGNGGRGGSVIIRVSSRLRSLEPYRFRRLMRAENGVAGGTSRRQGRCGHDLIIDVPRGTLIKDGDTSDVIRDLTQEGDEVCLCEGGRGGRGNASFKTATRQAPALCTPGKAGQERFVELELKLIADVGLVGFPNAGKSTLVRSATRLPAKVASYPFTTLSPNVGCIRLPNHDQLLIADIPGIIEGAAQNRGLGLDFLRHIERTKMLVYMLDASGIDGRTPLDDFRVLRSELKEYDPALLDRPWVVALNKCDTQEAAEHVAAFKKGAGLANEKVLMISAVTGEGLPALIEWCVAVSV